MGTLLMQMRMERLNVFTDAASCCLDRLDLDKCVCVVHVPHSISIPPFAAVIEKKPGVRNQ
jgi:hypothetical protein